jgi:hypothetical protein
LGSRIQNAENIVLAHDDVVSALQLGVATGVLSKEDAVADFDVEGNQFAVIEPLAMPDGDHFALLWFLLRRIGDDDAAARGFLFLNPLHHDAVVQGSNVHNAPRLHLSFSL